MPVLVINAFSANMLSPEGATVAFDPLTLEQARAMAQGATSAVGHAETASVFGAVLGMDLPMNRATVALSPGQRCLLGQYVGPRLPEGATSLPPGASIRWMQVAVVR